VQHRFIFSVNIFLLEEKLKNTLNGDFCSISSGLSNDVSQVKFTLSFYNKIQLSLKKTV
jgi:hypothetical protein